MFSISEAEGNSSFTIFNTASTSNYMMEVAEVFRIIMQLTGVKYLITNRKGRPVISKKLTAL